jgi:hypothetical protein
VRWSSISCAQRERKAETRSYFWCTCQRLFFTPQNSATLLRTSVAALAAHYAALIAALDSRLAASYLSFEGQNPNSKDSIMIFGACIAMLRCIASLQPT